MKELLTSITAVCSYIFIAAGAMMLLRALCKLPDELFRKLLHFVLLGAYIPVLFCCSRWWHAVVFAVALAVAAYPLLQLAGRWKRFSSFVNERKKGEYKHSMLLALATMAVSVFVGWGLLNDRYLVLACIYAWGVGDAFAALVGKRFGRHKIRWNQADANKSIEGSAAMFATSAVSVFAVLLLRGGMAAGACAVVAVVAALVCTVVELCSKGGFDTVTCPAAAMAVVIPLMKLFGA